MPTSVQLSSTVGLRSIVGGWAFAVFLPLPILVATDPTNSADVSCLYLGAINAWLVMEFYRYWGLPGSSTALLVMMWRIITAVAVNVALFVGFGLAARVQTHFPFPLMAVLSVLPVIGVMPWMLRRVPNRPHAAIVFSGFLVFACKLAGCVVPRIVYGPDHLELGYAAAL